MLVLGKRNLNRLVEEKRLENIKVKTNKIPLLPIYSVHLLYKLLD